MATCTRIPGTLVYDNRTYSIFFQVVLFVISRTSAILLLLLCLLSQARQRPYALRRTGRTYHTVS